MTKTAKVAISLPEGLLQRIERERVVSGESRSQFFRRATEALLRQMREHELEEQYVRGYKRYPETKEEIVLAESTAQWSLAESPWEDGSRQ